MTNGQWLGVIEEYRDRLPVSASQDAEIVAFRSADDLHLAWPEAEYVVVACGCWSPKMARMAGAVIPLTPAVHQMKDIGPVPRFADAKGDIQRGLEVAEFATGIPHLLKGEYTEGAGPGIDIYSMRQPLGVVAAIVPFNYPVELWSHKVAGGLAAGNAVLALPVETRLTPAETAGLDVSEHGMWGYPEFYIPVPGGYGSEHAVATTGQRFDDRQVIVTEGQPGDSMYVVQSGKARYIGSSNHSGWTKMRALATSDRMGLTRYISQQIRYSLLDRTCENELRPLGVHEGVGAAL